MVAISELQRDIDSEPQGRVFTDLSPQELQEYAIRNEGAKETVDGVIVVKTEPTGRYPKGKGIVVNESAEKVDFGDVNRPVSPTDFAVLEQRAQRHLAERDSFIHHGFVRTDVDTVMPVKVTSSSAWSVEFAHQLLVRKEQVEKYNFHIEGSGIELTHVPHMPADIDVGEVRQSRAVVTSFGATEGKVAKTVIAGTEYAGEIKKNVFNILNWMLPQRGIFPVHASVNADPDSDESTVFFGLSGTGKTTLSNDPSRVLIGDDEHGISERGTFNFEGGSYAKAIKLSAEGEPDIYRALRTRGAVLENVDLNAYGEPVYTGQNVVENMRGAYPIDFIPYADPKGVAAVPSRVVFLTADEGILPAVSKLTTEQALYHAYSGYTATMPGTVAGINEPLPTFSEFYGHAFLTLAPQEYGRLLEEYLERSGPEVYLVNTGWQGGYDPNNLRRRDLALTRRVISAINNGELNGISYHEDELGFLVPDGIAGVPAEYLDSRYGWGSDQVYENKALALIGAFSDNINRFAGVIAKDVMAAGPRFS